MHLTEIVAVLRYILLHKTRRSLCAGQAPSQRDLLTHSSIHQISPGHLHVPGTFLCMSFMCNAKTRFAIQGSGKTGTGATDAAP